MDQDKLKVAANRNNKGTVLNNADKWLKAFKSTSGLFLAMQRQLAQKLSDQKSIRLSPKISTKTNPKEDSIAQKDHFTQ